ncbi:hypothetical protein [Dongia sedimenti]|uniref:Secreted protein n=1 Tax=Dongia sedimenti TaxID=3064282 RepID=A0ABU0YSC9_9PROT|nr:hypothetical protein [Rhodospirillaceae bacterium R-7]
MMVHRIAQKTAAILFGVGLAFGLTALPAAATTLLVDQGMTTLDSNTGLEWLDITLTQGQSYNAVAAGYGGYTTSGWRFATITDLYQLFTDAGGGGSYPVGTTSSGSNPAFAAATLLSLRLGTLYFEAVGDTLQFGADGYLADVLTPGKHFTGAWDVMVKTGSVYGELFAINQRDNSVASPYYGSFLVRNTVATTPVPPALLLFLTALGGLGVAAWRRRTGTATA